MKGKAKIARKPNNINTSLAKISWKLGDPPQELEDIISPTLFHQLKGKLINNLYLSPRNKRSLAGIKCKSTTRLVSRHQTRKELDESPKINHQNSSNYLGDMYDRKLQRDQLNATVDAQSQTVDSLTKLKLPPISMKTPPVITPQLFKLKLFPMMEELNSSQKLKSSDSPTSEKIHHSHSTLSLKEVNKIPNIVKFQSKVEEAHLAIIAKPQTKLLRRTIGPSLFKTGIKSNSPELKCYSRDCQKIIGKAEQLKYLQKVQELSDNGFIEKAANKRLFLNILKEEELQLDLKKPFENENLDLINIMGKDLNTHTEKGKKLIAFLQRKGTLGFRVSKRFINIKTNYTD